ncbi:MAG: SPOR domain-containing protein [Bacteroidales bacterium]|nr:SPOR domain-containing protein [Bacteroidales bacterium]
MQVLIEKLEGLLAEHDCVVVPGLGGFIQQESEACYDPEREIFHPRSRQLSFNARLDFNDGLLTAAYQAGFGLSFEAANQRIREAVALLRDQMAEGRYVSLGQLGTMHLNEEEALTFLPQGGNVLSPALFGLKAIPCSVARPVSSPVRKEPSEASRQPSLVAQWGHWAAAAAAAVLLILFFGSQPLNRAGYNLNQASVLGVDTDMLARVPVADNIEMESAMPESSPADVPVAEPVAVPAAEPEPALEPVADPAVEPAAEPATTVTPSETTVAARTTQTPRTTQAAQTVKTPSKGSSKQYLIVIASFPDENSARRYIERRQLRDSFPEVGVAVGAEHYRVYVTAYSSRLEAVASLPAFRSEHPRYAKAWVLVQ